MTKQITGNQYIMKDLLGEKFLFVIPNYQRPYSWEVDNAEELFNDMHSFMSDPAQATDTYFLGSIVLIKEEAQPTAQVVDGQQRLTTLITLMSVLTSFMSGNTRLDYQNYVLQPERESQGMAQQARLTMRSSDHVFFEKYVLQLRFDEMFALDPSNCTESQRKLLSNAQHFFHLIKTRLNNDVALIKQFASFIVQRCCMVAVTTPSEDTAFRVFAVLNSRGLDLLPTDIIKAKIIGRLTAEGVAEDDIEAVTRDWERLEEKCSRKGFDEVLGHVRSIYIHRRPHTNIRDEFEKLIIDPAPDLEAFLSDEFFKYVKAYLVLKKKNWKSVENAGEINELIGWLNRTESEDWMPVAMRFVQTHGRTADMDYCLWFFKRLECMAAYFQICSISSHSRLERYYGILSAMSRDHSAAAPLTEIELTAEEKANFLAHLNADIYLKASRRRNYVMLRLDRFLADGVATYHDKLKSIEHVLPQTVDAGTEWATLWPDETYRKMWVHKLGNLVLLPRNTNSRASNKPFAIKKGTYYDGKSGVSSFALTSQVIAENAWSPEVVEKRQAALIGTLSKEWNLG